MKRIYLGFAFLLFGILIAVSRNQYGYDLLLAICWGSGIIGLFNAIFGYFPRNDVEAGAGCKDNETDSKNGE